MKEEKRSAIYKIGQYFMQNEKKQLFKIVDMEWIGTIQRASQSKVKEPVHTINDWLYYIQYVNPVGKQEYSRYYEGRLSTECTLVANQKLPKTIYE